MGRKRRGRAKIDGIGIYSEWEFNKGVKVWEGNREEVKESKTTTTTKKTMVREISQGRCRVVSR